MSILLELALLVLVASLVIFLFRLPSVMSERKSISLLGHGLSEDNFLNGASKVLSEGISDGLDKISDAITSLDDSAPMFKCEDGTLFSLTSVIGTYRDGDGFRVELSGNGNGTLTKSISIKDHEQMLVWLSEMGCVVDEEICKRMVKDREEREARRKEREARVEAYRREAREKSLDAK